MINPMDLTFKQKVELVTNAGRIPRGDGVNFKHFLEVELDKIVQRTGNKLTNKVRAEGLIQETVSAFVDRINENRYLFTYEQPTVKKLPNGLYELICGEHRLQAHYLTGRKTIFVAVVDFDSLEDQMIFQSNENNEDDEYVKAPRTQNDVILTLANMVEVGIIDINDDKSINARLTRLNQKTNEFPTLREKLRAKYGIITPVKTYDDEGRKQWVQQYKPEVQFSSRSNIVPVDSIAYLNKTFKGGSGKGGVKDLDYDPRAFFDACYLLQNSKVNKVDIVCSINGATSEKLPKIRDYKKQSMMQDMLNRCIQIVDDYRAGKYNPIEDVSFNFVPQIDSIDNMEEWA
jgi:hypothetical protein